jgi:hypothetical protein
MECQLSLPEKRVLSKFPASIVDQKTAADGQFLTIRQS